MFNTVQCGERELQVFSALSFRRSKLACSSLYIRQKPDTDDGSQLQPGSQITMGRMPRLFGFSKATPLLLKSTSTRGIKNASIVMTKARQVRRPAGQLKIAACSILCVPLHAPGASPLLRLRATWASVSLSHVIGGAFTAGIAGGGSRGWSVRRCWIASVVLLAIGAGSSAATATARSILPALMRYWIRAATATSVERCLLLISATVGTSPTC
jgi:hypothetical protein